MKKIITFILIITTCIVNAQVIIGNDIGSATDKTSVILEFATGTNKGIILPYVRTLPANPTEGTLILNATTPTTARVNYYNGEWVDLSLNDGNITSSLVDQPTTAEDPESKIIIGAETSTADGILVLESTTKAMILPLIDNVLNIPNPSPGMIVFINRTGAKRFAVFNGLTWAFWQK